MESPNELAPGIGENSTMNRFGKRSTRLAMLMALVISCVGCDQVTKRIASENLVYAEPMSFLGDTIRIQYIENPGGFLGLGRALPDRVRFWLFTVLNAGFLIAVGYVLVSKWNMDGTYFAACALILAGGIGNQIDRFMKDGLVIDFLNVGIGRLRTGVFNVADVALTSGFFILIVLMMREGKPSEPAVEA